MSNRSQHFNRIFVDLQFPCHFVKSDGKLRFPDEMTLTKIIEVKNVAKQSLTRQIKDYLKLAKDLKTGFTLIVREGDNTKLSKPLLGKKTAGEIILKQILPNP